MMSRSALRFALPVLLAVGLAGCAGTGGHADGVQQAVSHQTATSDDLKRAKVHTELGTLYLREGRFAVALDEARIAIESERSYAPAYNLRGLTYMALRQNEQAEQSFRRALELAGNDPEINDDFGWFLCQTERPRDALAHFRVAIANPLYQSPGKALTNAGLCSILLKEDRQAEEYLLRAVRLDRRNVTALYWLADIAYRGKRYADAKLRMQDLHTGFEPTPETTWLALRIDRKLGDRDGEARNMGILRRKFRDSSEYLKMSRGEFD